MNPFAHFALGSELLSGGKVCEQVSSTCSDAASKKSDANSPCHSLPVSSPSRKRTIHAENFESSTPDSRTTVPKKKKKTVNKSSPEIMKSFWKELKSLTSNYPFAVLLTGVLGAQTRDIVTVGVMRQLAVSLGGDICPLNICSKSFEELEINIKRLNYCHKKTKSMMNLASIFTKESVPSTMHGLKTIPGVGPVISELILQVAFEEKFGLDSSDSVGDKGDTVDYGDIGALANTNNEQDNSIKQVVEIISISSDDDEDVFDDGDCV